MVDLQRTIANLARNNIKSFVLDSRNDILTFLDSQIPDGVVVGVGDSVTLEVCGVYKYLRDRNLKFLDKYLRSLSSAQKKELYLQNFNADFFISSANAVSSEGKIYNLDGNGSRVAPIIYGPKKVFLVCGINKIVDSEETAFDRIRLVAAPLDAKRLQKKTPCSVTGRCSDCHSPDRICNYYSIVQGQFDG
ncbi:MAG TPA: lactate utilization protein, partial [Prolixibacteraceae bacterium]|nr:lactate utilization protein [Prolixibacteraceae bacterium]